MMSARQFLVIRLVVLVAVSGPLATGCAYTNHKRQIDTYIDTAETQLASESYAACLNTVATAKGEYYMLGRLEGIERLALRLSGQVPTFPGTGTGAGGTVVIGPGGGVVTPMSIILDVKGLSHTATRALVDHLRHVPGVLEVQQRSSAQGRVDIEVQTNMGVGELTEALRMVPQVPLEVIRFDPSVNTIYVKDASESLHY